MSFISQSDKQRLSAKACYQATKPGSFGNTIRYQGFITYAAHLRAYAIYSLMFGTSQSANRLLERGGFGEGELDEFYPEWRNHILNEQS